MPDAAHLLPLIGLTFLLGLRHGMDPDHLVAVDNLTRYNAAAGGTRARWCGMFFSLGHGAVVMAVAAALAVAAGSTRIPPWVEAFGQAVSIAFLLAIGAVNLRALRDAPAGAVAPRGLRGRAWQRATRVRHPLAIAAIGAAFAVSMDTLSQAAVFSMAATGRLAWGAALLLGAVFTLGMLVVDALNGWWVNRMLGRLDGTAQAWLRRLTLAIALLSLGLAAAGIARLAHARLDAWYDGHALALGAASIAVTSAIYLAAMARSRAVRRAGPARR